MIASLNLRFELKGRPRKDGKDVIRATYRLPNGERKRFNSDFAVSKELWNGTKGIVKGKSKTAKAINEKLRNAKAKADDVEADALKNERHLTEVDAKKVLATLAPISHKADTSDHSITEYLNLISGKAKATLDNYASLANNLIEFEACFNRKPTQWHHLTNEWFHEWTEWMTKPTGRGMSPNSANKRIANLTAAVNASRGIEHTIEFPTKWKKLKVTKADKKQRDWLSSEQVELLSSKKLPSHLQGTRDLLLIGIYTGLRVSDWGQFLTADISERGSIIDITTQKTNRKVTVQITPKLKAIRDRYNEGMVPLPYYRVKPTECTANTYTITTNTIRKQAKKIGKLLDFEIKGTHTARRTFGRILWKAKVVISRIQVAYGHADYTETIKYLGLDDEKVRDEVASMVSQVLA